MNTNKNLGERIEKLVRELVEAHLDETRATVLAAVTRSFGNSTTSIPAARAAKSKTRSFKGRRTPEEVSAQVERLYQAVCAKPGEAMVTFATEIGTSARALHRPITILKKSGRVRSVGERNRTRYFPSVGSKTLSEKSAGSGHFAEQGG